MTSSLPTAAARGLAAALALASLTAAAPTDTTPPPPGTDPTDLAVCTRLATQPEAVIAPSLVRSASLDIDGDGKPERLVVNTEGTADVDSYEVTRADGQSVTVEPADAGYGDGAFVYGTQRWLVQDGKAYVLTFDGRGTGYLAYALRITPDFKERPVCRFAPRTRTTLAAVSAPQAFCDAVADRRVAAARVSPFAPQTDPRFDVPGGKAALVGRANVDWANAGARQAVYLAKIETGAGAGCTLSYFDTREAETPARRRLMALQHMAENDAYPRGGCEDATSRWLVWRGRTYLDTRSTHADAPSGEQYEYREIAWLAGGRPHVACRATYAHEAPRLTAWWTDGHWSPQP